MAIEEIANQTPAPKIADRIKLIPRQMQNELEYVRNKKTFSPEEPVAVKKKKMPCKKNMPRNPYITLSWNSIRHIERIAYVPQTQVVISLLYLGF